MKTLGYATQTADAPLAPFAFERRALRANDVAMEVLSPTLSFLCALCCVAIHSHLFFLFSNSSASCRSERGRDQRQIFKIRVSC
jgi:hypothetical protein